MMRIAALAATVMLASGVAFAQGSPAPVPPSAPLPQYFPLELPAGANLISSPLDADGALARSMLLGMPPDWPLFYTWDSTTQSFVDADAVPVKQGSGFWAFVPTPSTLVAWGQPYSYAAAVTRHLEPGWHLVGIPFTEGIPWSGFRVFTSGNPVDLETARRLGWVGLPPISLRGSQYYYQSPGDSFQPGFAYWLLTTTPLEIRVDRPAPGVAAGMPTGVASASGVVGWLSSIADAMVDMTLGGWNISQGNWVTPGFYFLAGGFGLLEYGLGLNDKDPVIEELDQMDAKLDLLVTEVGAISSQLGQVVAQIEGLQDFIASEVNLGIPMGNAETWLDSYYLDVKTTAISREWARWVLAGCNPALQTTCPSLSNPVTTDNYDKFVAAYMQNPGGTTKATDDFPLWWAVSVIGNQIGGVSPYYVAGTTADGLVGTIKHGLLDNMGTPQNGLYAYMQFVLSQSGCAIDVSSPNCDLYGQVYVPVEAYFAQAIGYQAQLVEAVAESYGVLAERDPAGFGTAVANYMTGANQMVNQEIESFLRVAEAIALYRAADGRWDWGTFPPSDAGQLLARADFVASRLGIANSPDHPVSGYIDPPWPKSGVVGRVFYVNGQGVSTSRGVCAGTGQDYCTSPTAQLAEVTSSNRTVQGDWPYIQWIASGTSAQGTPTTQWAIQRFAPSSMADGSYIVNSSEPTRGGASLTVADYDSDYNTPPVDTSDPPITFGSFSSIEGWIGRHGLRYGVTTWTESDCGSNSTHQFAVGFDSTHYTVNLIYPTGSSHQGTQSGTCTQTAKLTVDTSTVASTYKSVHLHWPASVNIAVNSKVDAIWGGGDGWYYGELGFSQQLLDSNGKTVANMTSVDYKPCNSGSSGFNACTYINSDQSLDKGPFQLTSGASYTLKYYLHSKCTPYEVYGPGYGYHREATAGSSAQWVTSYPVFTLSKD